MTRLAPGQLRFVVPALLAAVAIAACTARPSSPPSSPAPETPAPAASPSPAAPTSPAGIKAGGLASTRAELTTRWGPAQPTSIGDLIFAGGRYVAGGFSSDRSSRFTVDFGEREPTSLASAAQLAEELMPADAVPGGILDLREGWVGRLYRSATLATVISDPAAYPAGDPGDFVVLYQMSVESPDRIIRLVMATGATP